MDKVKKLLSTNMKRLRQQTKISQLALAEMANLSVQMIRDIEAGRRWPSAATLDSVSTALEVRVSDLFLENSKDHVSALEIKKAIKVISEAHGYDIIKTKS